MKFFIVTSNKHKEKELSQYFSNIGIKTTHIKNLQNVKISELLEEVNEEYFFIGEQTSLLDENSNTVIQFNEFQKVIHHSTLFATSYKKDDKNNIIKVHKKYSAEVKGFLFPHLKTGRKDIYNWDDIFISEKSMISYQNMKEKGIKNSARDLSFSLFINDNLNVFKFKEKVNLNFNKMNDDQVISFEPFIEKLINEHPYYKVCAENSFFGNILSNIIQQGIFVKKSEDRIQRNYWIPGLNAGIPLTPKKDQIHELTFMFHDLMHFIFPDLFVLEDTIKNKHIYIISRMMSEAFTIILADVLYISLLSKSNLDYDFNKRKIFPLFKNMSFDIDFNNIDKIKELLWANTCFALLGREKELKILVQDDNIFEDYKQKYQRFFQEDYIWTENNYNNISHNCEITKKWYNRAKKSFSNLVTSTDDYVSNFNEKAPILEQVKIIFDEMFLKLCSFSREKNSLPNQNNAFKRYMLGQINIFYKYETIYNTLFLDTIFELMQGGEENNAQVLKIYNSYLDKLVELDLITHYERGQYKNIYPIFSPFYVFYDQNEKEHFTSTVSRILEVK